MRRQQQPKVHRILWCFDGLLFPQSACSEWRSGSQQQRVCASHALVLLRCPAPAATAARWGLRGAAVGAGGLLATLGFALLGPASGAGWPRAEVFGLHPDPTALITLALLPGLPGGWRRGLLALIPLLWLALSALHLQVLQAAWWPLLLLAAGASLLGLLLVGLRDRGAAPR